MNPSTPSITAHKKIPLTMRNLLLLAIPLLLITIIILLIVLNRQGESTIPNFENVAVGDVVAFGSYYWRVLDMQEDKALLLSEYIIRSRPFRNSATRAYLFNRRWVGSPMRRYLNGQFYRQFTRTERTRIMETEVYNPWTRHIDSTDKIFVLSAQQAVNYLGDGSQMQNLGSSSIIDDPYNQKRIAKNESGDAAWWWLLDVRMIDTFRKNAAVVHPDGSIDRDGISIEEIGGVRPALWISLE